MKRIDTATAWIDKFGAGKNGFRNGDPGIPIASTDLDEGWFDHVQEEIANVIEGAGLVLDEGEYDQLLLAIESIAAGLAAKGVSQGRIVYATPSTIKMVRGLEGLIRFEIDDLLLTSAVDLTWDLTADLDVGGEAANTWYYPYLENVAGVLTPHLSATPPEMDPALGKVGYHPGVGKEGWRAIPLAQERNSYLAILNNAGSNIEPFDLLAGELRLRHGSLSYTLATTSAANPTFLELDMNGEVPATVREVLVNSELFVDDIRALYAPEAAVGQTAAAYVAAITHISRGGTTAETANSAHVWVPIDDPADPRIAYANQIVGGSGFVTTHTLVVMGWR